MSSLFATIFALPITAYYFYSVSLAGIITNLVILPLTPIVVIGGILSSVVGIFFEGAGTFLAGSVAAVLQIYKFVLSLAGEIEFLNIITGRPPVYLCVIYYAGVIILTTMKDFKAKSLLLPTGLLAAFVIISFNGRILKNTEIAFLDVGQGDSAVITDYSGNTFVIDTGGSWVYDEEDNTGVRFVYPYLQYKGKNSIDVLFISHPDSDHALGSLGLLDKCDVKKLVFADFDYEQSKLYDRIIEKAAQNETELVFVSAGDIIKFGDISFECIYPYEDSTGDDNDGSMVLKFTYGNFSVLFTGDLGKEQEEILLENDADLSADVLKVAHHGSKYSTSEEFVSAVGFSEAIISVGENNTYGHPHEEVLKVLSGKNVYATDECGAVIIKTNGEKYGIKTVK